MTGHSPFRAWAGHPCASTAHPVSPHPCPDRRPSVSPAQYLPYRASDEVLVCNLFVPCGATVVYRVVRTTCSLSNVRTMYPNQTRCCLYVLVPVPVLCALGSVCPFCRCSSRLMSYKHLRPAGPGLALAPIAVNPSFHWDSTSLVRLLPIDGTFRCARDPRGLTCFLPSRPLRPSVRPSTLVYFLLFTSLHRQPCFFPTVWPTLNIPSSTSCNTITAWAFINPSPL